MSGVFGGPVVRAVRGALRVWVQGGYAEADEGQGVAQRAGVPSCQKA